MKKLMIASIKKIVRNVYIPLDLIIKLLTIGNALVYGYTSSAIVLGSIFLVWSGITLGVSMLGIVLGGFVNKLEVTFILENLGTILDAKPFAAILLAILLLGNLWVLTHYLEKDIRTSGAVIGSAYVLVWGVTCTCVVYNIFGYFGLLPLIGAFSVSLSRIAIGTGLFVYGHSGIFVRSFWTFTEDFRDGLILVWQGLRFRNWDRRTKYYFYNTVLLMAFFGLATTHQEVYLMASPDTWEDLFKVLKFQDITTKDQSWRDIPISQLIGDKGEIKISLQEATPEQVKRILYYKLSESPEALAAAGYGIWHVVMGFLGGIGTGLSLYFLFKGGGGGPPPPPPPSGGGDAVVPKGNPLPSEREATGEGSTVALPIVAPVENKDATEAPVENEVPIVAPVENKDATEAPVENEVPIVAPVENRGPIVAPGENKVPMVSNSMEGEFLVLFEAPSAPITREEGRIEANVFIAGSDKRAEEARGFSGENSSKDVESLTSLDEIGATGEASTLALPIVAPGENKETTEAPVENEVPIEALVENKVPTGAPVENKVPMVSNSMEGEFLVLFEAPSAPITREEGRIEANVFIAGSDKRAEEARGFSGENSSKDVESLTSLYEIGATGEASTLALPIVAPGENKETTEAPVENEVPIEALVENKVPTGAPVENKVPMVSNSMEGEFLVLFEAPSAPITREEGRIEANVFIAGSDKRAEEARGFSGENSSKDVESLTSLDEIGATGEASTLALPIVAPVENKVPIEGIVENRVFPTFLEIGDLVKENFYSAEEQRILDAGAKERKIRCDSIISSWVDVDKVSDESLIKKEQEFLVEFAKFAEIHKKEAEALLLGEMAGVHEHLAVEVIKSCHDDFFERLLNKREGADMKELQQDIKFTREEEKKDEDHVVTRIDNELDHITEFMRITARVMPETDKKVYGVMIDFCVAKNSRYFCCSEYLEALSAPITREDARIAANVSLAGSDKRAEEARGFSGENSSKDVESLTSLDEIGATGEASTLALPIVAPGENKETTEAPVENEVPIEALVENKVPTGAPVENKVPMVSNSMEGEFLVLFEAPSAPITREEGRIEANVFIAGSDNRSEEARGFSGENSSKDVGSLTSLDKRGGKAAKVLDAVISSEIKKTSLVIPEKFYIKGAAGRDDIIDLLDFKPKGIFTREELAHLKKHKGVTAKIVKDAVNVWKDKGSTGGDSLLHKNLSAGEITFCTGFAELALLYPEGAKLLLTRGLEKEYVRFGDMIDIKANSFREGIKLGEIRRAFQASQEKLLYMRNVLAAKNSDSPFEMWMYEVIWYDGLCQEFKKYLPKGAFSAWEDDQLLVEQRFFRVYMVCVDIFAKVTGSSHVEANRAAEVRGFSEEKQAAEDSSAKKGRVDSIQGKSGKDLREIVPKLLSVAGLSEKNFYSEEEQRILDAEAKERKIRCDSIISSWVAVDKVSDEFLEKKGRKFLVEFAKYARIHEKEAEALLLGEMAEVHERMVVTVTKHCQGYEPLLNKRERAFMKEFIHTITLTREEDKKDNATLLSRIEMELCNFEEFRRLTARVTTAEEKKDLVEIVEVFKAKKSRYFCCLEYLEYKK